MRAVLGLLLVICIQASQISWIPDTISYLASIQANSHSSVQLAVSLSTNAPLYDEEPEGNFAIVIQMKQGSIDLYARTDCIPAVATAAQVRETLESTNIRYQSNKQPLDPVGKYYDITSTKYGNQSSLHVLFQVTLSKWNNGSALAVQAVAVNTTACATTRTVGLWDDASRWTDRHVPNATDSVSLPVGSGVVKLLSNVTVASLNISDGVIIAHSTQCPAGWTTSKHGNKCFQLIAAPLPFAAADHYCNAIVGQGSADRHLVHVKDRTELNEVYGLCRGAGTADGCWIGLQDPLGDGQFDWIDPQAVGGEESSLFLDWRRFEPNNHTVSHDVESAGGERCAATYPGTEDAVLLEQGGWVDDACLYPRPFVCQAFKVTDRYSMHAASISAQGGQFVGGHLIISSSSGQQGEIRAFTVTRTATLTLNQSTSVGQLHLEDGSQLILSSLLHLSDGSFIGETASLSAARMQSALLATASSKINMTCTAAACQAIINARVEGLGRIRVSAHAQLTLLQGGDLAQAKVQLAASSAQLVLSGYAGRMSTYDAFELTVANRGPFMGEYRGTDSSIELATSAVGLYRLLATSSLTSSTSQCIPYDADDVTLMSILNNLPVAQAAGGAVVRRYGNHNNSRYAFGYTYRIELNRPSTSTFSDGPVALGIACYGIAACQCAEALVPALDAAGTPACPLALNYSITNTQVCNVPPALAVSRISRLSYTNTSGSGSIVMLDGTHRLPPLAAVTLAVAGTATGIVAADVVAWYALQAKDVGQLVVTGLGWEGWDSALLLYAPSWTDERGLTDYLRSAPTAQLTASSFYLDGMGSVLVAAPNASMTWRQGTWNGGIIGGMASLLIADSIVMSGTGKSIKYSMTVTVAATAAASWLSGNISLANGAALVVAGNLTIDNHLTAALLPYPMTIGEARYLQSSSADPAVLLVEEEGRSWQSYYSSALLPALRPGWYTNPLCDSRCADTNTLEVRGRGALVAMPSSAVSFLLPVNLVGSSRMAVGASSNITLASGGTCGNLVTVDLSQGTQLTLSGGQMEMQATCTIQGAGELLVVAGSHFLAFSIDAHITIAGGTLLWPESRGVQKTITFNGGLLLTGTGVLEVQPFSTTVLVHKEVRLTGDCLIQFPLIGIAAQASTFDSSDAPDTSPRGNFTATGVMVWEGGTLKGKADFNVLTALYLDGSTKYIASLAKLVNKGHCEWGDGDIATSDNGDFQNFGTVQMRGNAFAANALYKGAALPVENGGDVFALQYHSWDTDLGALNTEEYVRLTAQLVSRVPTGWTPSDQQQGR